MILGVETSCDETAAAVVTGDGRVLSSIVSSQADLHARFGGVVPEVASRRHLELVAPVIRTALESADVTLDEVEQVAVTQGPGLVGALLVGISTAKALAWSKGLPLVPVDHLEGHVASLYLGAEPLEPPFTCLLASGGHTLLLAVRERGTSERLGTTLDDAAGEAFDKGARLLGLGYPGGAAIDRVAGEGDPDAFDFPVARVPGLDFSFSGLKTALLYATRDLGPDETERLEGGSRSLLSACDRPRARGTAPRRRRVDGLLARRGRGRRGGELRASRDAARRAVRPSRAVHGQRCDDRLVRAVRRAAPASSLPCPRCVRISHVASSR